MKDWWNNLQSREQNMVMLASIVVLAFVLYAMVWSPLIEKRDQKRQSLENNQELLTWMTSKSQEVKQLKRANPSFRQVDSKRSLLAVVDSLAKTLGVRNSINRIDPDGPHNATIWIDSMNFDALITLLGQLDKRNNVKVIEADMSKLDKPGIVKAKVSLKRI